MFVCDDVLIDVFNFLTRKRLSQLDESCSHFHDLVQQHCPLVLHVIPYKKLIIKMWPPSPAAAVLSPNEAGLFKLTEILCDDMQPDPKKIVSDCVTYNCREIPYVR